MEKLDYGDYMDGEIVFNSKADEKACLQCWNEGIEIRVDEYGRVYNEGGIYIADIKIK
ncbi:hypothetical protein FSBG_00360 [Fusobacterium gonidiaformans 3-1-5R]|uniref:Uncharacterized protein n=2 Tax=Fusobacterium TaxID=848 RepID=E5BFI2_9FUSO|nr:MULTISPECIES: hypothetical protein [Fusobacterium]EFS20863.1 hypothetical protein FSBG_00360 [Fusobacterium gonidiaformans 3-1-5R]KXA14324.1 hypothetical protein HMPREF3206_01008 [Fusobacterium equinum]